MTPQQAQGTQVQALPSGSNETLTEEQLLDHDLYEGPRNEIEGILEIIQVPEDPDFNAPAYTLYLVDNTPVDPATIKQSHLTASIKTDYVAYLRETIQDFFNHAHDAKGRFAPKEGAQGGPRKPPATPADIRKWAKENNVKVGERGRLHPDVISAYKKAQRAVPKPTVKPTPKSTSPESTGDFQTRFAEASKGLSEQLKSLATIEQKAGGPRYKPVVTDDVQLKKETEQRVHDVGMLLHNEITERLSKRGVNLPPEREALLKKQEQFADQLDKINKSTPNMPSALELHRKMFPGTSYLQATDEQFYAVAKEIDKTVPGYLKAREGIENTAAQLNKLDKQEEEYTLNYRTTALQVLSEARNGNYGNISFDKVQGSLTSNRQTSKEVIESFQRAGSVYPDDWVANSNADGSLYTEAKARGLHTFRPNSVHYTMMLKGRNGEPDKPGYKRYEQNSAIETSRDPNSSPAVDKSTYFPTSVHELGHRFEELRPHIKVMEEAFFNRRTQGEEAQSLKTLRPEQAYTRDEKAKPDKFRDPYIGKIYEGGSSSPYEVFTMGVQGMLGGSHWIKVHRDPDYAAFILGILATG